MPKVQLTNVFILIFINKYNINILIHFYYKCKKNANLIDPSYSPLKKKLISYFPNKKITNFIVRSHKNN